MKNQKIVNLSREILELTKIEVFHSLAEHYGSQHAVMEVNASKGEKVDFQVDRLFSIFHQN